MSDRTITQLEDSIVAVEDRIELLLDTRDVAGRRIDALRRQLADDRAALARLRQQQFIPSPIHLSTR